MPKLLPASFKRWISSGRLLASTVCLFLLGNHCAHASRIEGLVRAAEESGIAFREIFNAVQAWGFLAWVTFIPMKKLVLGAVVAIGGVFLPSSDPNSKAGELSLSWSDKVKIGFKGLMKYGLLVIGILIILSAFWDSAAVLNSDIPATSVLS